jgi:hypothetical protein
MINSEPDVVTFTPMNNKLGRSSFQTEQAKGCNEAWRDGVTD